MSTLRAIAVAVLTLAVAALPVAGVGVSAAHADCMKASAAPHAQHEMGKGHHAEMNHAKADQEVAGAERHDRMAPCGGPSKCGGKCLCLGLSAVMPGFLATNPPGLPRAAATRVAVHLSGPAYVPPSPPPRV